MLGDAELQGLNTQLDGFQITHKQHRDTLQELLQNYQDLVEEYRRLRSDYEEEKESREKYKKLARGQVCFTDTSRRGCVLILGLGSRNAIRLF
jgi:CHASE3 domain sensor protein